MDGRGVRDAGWCNEERDKRRAEDDEKDFK